MTHPLTAWLARNNLSLRQFSKEIGVNASTVQRLLYGKSDVTTTLIRTVSDATGGEVPQQTLYLEWLRAYSARVSQQEMAD